MHIEVENLILSRHFNCGTGPLAIFIGVLNFPFWPANFGSIIEVILEYVDNRRSDKPAGGVEQTGLIPRMCGCPCCRCRIFFLLFYLTFSYLSAVRLTSFVEAVLPPHIEMPQIEDLNAAHGAQKTGRSQH